VLTRGAPPYSVISGNPAKFVKQFEPIERVWAMGAIHSADTELVIKSSWPMKMNWRGYRLAVSI
jgi:hypothetical protein